MSIAIIIVAIVVGISIFYVMTMNKAGKEMLDNGSVIKRPGGFYSKAEIFTLRRITSEEFNKAAEGINFPVPSSGKTYDAVFTGAGFEARLKMVQESETQCVYRFVFTRWKSRNGNPDISDLLTMNQLLTAVEKVFLKLDPGTQVRTEEVERKTSPSFL